MEDNLTPEEAMALANTELDETAYGYPAPEEKQNMFSFFKRVITMPDTLRTANLTQDELGGIRIPVRTLHKLSLYCNEMGLGGLGSYFAKEARIITNSSLSREGFLDCLAITQRRELEEKTRAPATEAQKKNWFKKKDKGSVAAG